MPTRPPILCARFIVSPTRSRPRARRQSVAAPVTGRGRRQFGAAPGQGLLEFALTLTIFITVTVGLLDGLRVIYYNSQVQEVAREGARWGSVEVARQVNGALPWGSFADPGNAPGVYCDHAQQPACTASLAGSRFLGTQTITPTIVGQAAVAATAMDLTQATITVSTTIPANATEPLQTSSLLTNVPISVTVRYPFTPLLSLVFGGAIIWLQGTSTMLHE